VTARDARAVVPRVSLSGLTRTGGIAALTGTKAADLALTLPMLAARPAAERNPAAAFVHDAAGPVGLLALGALAVALIVAATEAGSRRLAQLGARRWVPALRVGCYGGAALLWLAAGLRNAAVVSGSL
jgi:hypothetical protein